MLLPLCCVAVYKHTYKHKGTSVVCLRITLCNVDGAQVEQSPDMCVLDVMLVYEVFSDKNAALLYPFNTLRNLARLQARTPVLALLDGETARGVRSCDVQQNRLPGDSLE